MLRMLCGCGIMSSNLSFGFLEEKAFAFSIAFFMPCRAGLKRNRRIPLKNLPRPDNLSVFRTFP